MEAVLELRKKNGPLEVAGGELGQRLAYLGVARAALGKPDYEASWNSGVRVHANLSRSRLALQIWT